LAGRCVALGVEVPAGTAVKVLTGVLTGELVGAIVRVLAATSVGIAAGVREGMGLGVEVGGRVGATVEVGADEGLPVAVAGANVAVAEDAACANLVSEAVKAFCSVAVSISTKALMPQRKPEPGAASKSMLTL